MLYNNQNDKGVCDVFLVLPPQVVLNEGPLNRLLLLLGFNFHPCSIIFDIFNAAFCNSK